MKVRVRPLPGRVTTGVAVPLVVALAAMIASRFGLAAGVGFDIAWTASALSASIGALAARSRARADNRGRWTLWSLAAGSWLFGQLAWDVYGVIGFPASPNIADLGWWGFAVLVMASMLRLPAGPRSVRIVALLESVPLIFAAVALCLAVLWSTAAVSRLGLAPKVAALVYPALYGSATMLTLQAMLGGTLRGLRTLPLGLALGGIAAQAFGFILWSVQLLHGTYVPGATLPDPVWVLGLGAIGVGGLLAAHRPEPAPQPEDPSSAGVVIPGGMFLALFAALVTAQLNGAPGGASVTLRLGLLCCGAALIARSTLLGRRLQALLHREQAALAGLAESEAELARLNEQLVEDSRRDPLTGLANRRALSDDVPLYRMLQRECGERIAVALCDADHFKAYNDRLGHLAGDQALRMFATTARGALREADTAYRFGGEELLLVLRDVDPGEALVIAERVRAAVRHAGFPHPDGDEQRLTVSIGVACGEEAFDELLARADSALYDAKRLGRNRVVLADPQAAAVTARPRHASDDGPVPRHLRGMLAVSRAAAAGQGARAVLDALAQAIRSELSFQVVVINLLEQPSEQLRVVVVQGDHDARATLLGTGRPVAEWRALLARGETIHGAAWLRGGAPQWASGGPVWTSSNVASLDSGGWQPDDMLLLPLRGTYDEILGVVSVDQPQLGRRPSAAEIGVLMAVVDHAGLALDQVQRERAVAQDQPDELRLAAVMLLAETLDLRDPGTARHSRTVGQLARNTALALALSPERIERIHAAGVLHDLGKLGIADAILQKPGPLDEAERREIRRHPDLGARILEHAGLHDIAGWVRAHHERIDGHGYPAELSGEAISLEARILAVVDAYEAMIADRPYRAGMPVAEARRELLRCAGTQFDTGVVAAFLLALPDAGTGTANRALEPAV